MKRKFLSALLCLPLCLSLLPAALAEEADRILSFPRSSYPYGPMGMEELLYYGDSMETRVLLPQQYNDIRQVSVEPNRFLVQRIVPEDSQDGGSIYRYGLVDDYGQFILPEEYTDCERGRKDQEDLLAFAKNGKYAYYSLSQEKFITGFDYDTAQGFDELGIVGVHTAYDENGVPSKTLYGAVNREGKLVIPLEYSGLEVYYYNGSFILAQKGEAYGDPDPQVRMGTFDYTGKPLRACVYPSYELLSAALCMDVPLHASGEAKLKEEELSITWLPQYDRVTYEPETARLGYRIGTEGGIAHLDGTDITGPVYHYGPTYSSFDGMGWYAYDYDAGEFIYLDPDGNILPEKPAETQPVSVPYLYDETYGFLLTDKQGNVLFPKVEGEHYDVAPWDAGEGLYGFVRNGKVGFADAAGRVVIEPQYAYSLYHSRGFDYCFRLNGLAPIYQDGGGRGFIDVKGNWYDRWDLGMLSADEGPNGKYGYRDEDWNLVVPYLFDNVGEFENGYALVRRDGVYGLLKDPRAENAAEEPSPAPPSGTAFIDVPAGSWFESGVKLCAERGIMIGMGDGTFAPNKTLTAAECLTLALRLYDLQRGGDGILEQLPDSWDDLTVTTADGSSVSGKLHDTFVYQTGSAKFNTAGGLQLRLTPDQMEWAKAQDSKDASITLLGKTYPAWATFAGSDDGVDGILFFYSPELSGGNNILAVLDSCLQHRGWWTNSLGHAFRLGLVDHDAHYGFWVLTGSTGPVTADVETSRFIFALALAEAAGDLPALKKMETIPDLERDFWGVDNSGTYMLYEAGVLTGKDESGSFDPFGDLTRAEAATMVARVLDPSLRIGAKGETPTSQPTASPAPSQLPINVEVGVIDSTYPSYNAALASLTEDGYHTIEEQLESPLCTVAVVSHTSPHGGVFIPYLIYKANSPLGEGLVRNLPSVRKGLMGYTPVPDTLALSEDGQTLTYSYHYAEPIVAEASGEVIRQAGTYTYTVELAKGLPTLDYRPLPDVVNAPNTTTTEVEAEVNRNLEEPFTTYAAAVEKLRSGMGYSNERTFDTDTCTIFCYDLGGFMNAPLDYLRVVYKAGGAYPEGTILDLPFTTDRGLHVNTRTDSMTLSGDGKTFTYTYTFEEIGNLGNKGNPVQAGGTYTYIFDVPSGTVTLTQPVLRTVTYAQALEQVTQEEGYTVEKIVEGAGVTAVLRYSLMKGRDNTKSYDIYLVYNSGGLKKEGTVDIERLPVTAADGLYIDRAPDHMFFSKDGRSFFCTYYYTPHDGSPYTSIIDLEQGYHSSGHLPTVVELLSNRATVDKRVDGPAATALLVYDEHDGAKDYILYLINKETGGIWPALLPSTYVGAAADGSVYYPTDRAPDSISFSADGSILTYVYKFAEALEKDGVVYHEAGTYTYKVNVTTGELSVAHM